jgi:hypothetical protein
MTTADIAIARRLSCRLDTLWDFTGVLIPRLQRLGLISARMEPRYREIGLLDA